MPFETNVIPTKILKTPIYQTIAEKATELHDLGMNYRNIAKALNISDKTIKKAIVRHSEWIKQANKLKASSHGQADLLAMVNKDF